MSVKVNEKDQLLKLRGEYFNSLDNLYDQMVADLDQLERDINSDDASDRKIDDQQIYKEKLANLRAKNV